MRIKMNNEKSCIVIILHPIDHLGPEIIGDDIITLNKHHKLGPHVLESEAPQVVDGEDGCLIIHTFEL